MGVLRALNSNDAGLLKELLEAGADPNVKWNNVDEHDRGLTPLMSAVSPQRSPELLELLLAHGADPHVATKKRTTALSRAVAYGNCQAAKRLLQAGCKADGTLLLRPVLKGNLDLIRAFIAAGADVNVRGIWSLRSESGTWEDRLADCTLLDGAVSERGSAIEHLRNLLPVERPRLEEKFRAKADLYFAIIQELIRAGADVNKIAGHVSPLYLAADSGDLEGLKLLLQGGADPNLTGKIPCDLPLHRACRGGFVEIAECLLQAGADVKMTNREGRTALEELRRLKRSSDLETSEDAAKLGGTLDPEMMKAKREAWNKNKSKLIELLESIPGSERQP